MSVVMENMTKTGEFPSFNSAVACREKAASLRAAAREAISDDLARTYLKIAVKWDEIATDYETTGPAH
jgi:hypothetical protein